MGVTEGCRDGIYSAFLLLMRLAKLILSAPLRFCLVLFSLQPSEHALYFPELGAAVLLEGEGSLRKIEEVNLIMPVGI